LERDYKIDASPHKCQKCGHVFAVGEEYFSAVIETQEEDRLARQNFCAACWGGEPVAYFSFWKTHVPEPAAANDHGPRLVDMGRLLQLFEHLADAPDPQALRFRYVLALVLMRKRRLKVLETRRLPGGRGEELTLREPGTDRRHIVACPNVTEEEIRSVADRLRDILDMPERWDNPASAEAPAVAPAVSPAEAPVAASAEAPVAASAEASPSADSPAAPAPSDDGPTPDAEASEPHA
jgi:hypothetical protein